MNEGPDERLRVNVDGGKYTYIMRENGSTYALRNGLPWIDSFTHIPGSGMILALAGELDDTRMELARLQEKINSTKTTDQSTRNT